MRRTLLVMTLGLGMLTSPLQAQDNSAGIQGTIQSQIDAFIADDFVTAFTFASPMIKGMFETPENFGRMVQQGYPMVWRPSDVRFLDMEDLGERKLQRVQILDQAGVPYIAEYEMIQTPEGWQINGVAIVRAPEIGA